MKRRLIIPAILFVPFGTFLLLGSPQAPSSVSDRSAVVAKGPLAVWSSYDGHLESRDVRMIMSRFGGDAIIIEVVSEGSKVKKGEVLARFDSSKVEREILQLERDVALAKSDLEGLQYAKIPLEIRDLKTGLLEVRSTLNAEKQYLDASIILAEEGLVSDQEIKHQRMIVEEARSQLETQEMQMRLTREFLHPSELKRARAKLLSAEQEVKLTREQLQNSVIFSPIDGVAVYKRIQIGAEFRTVRVGDEIHQNQVFMLLPDMRDFIVLIDVPERELPRVQEGLEVSIRPSAYPDMNIRGVIEKVGSMARHSPGQPAWKKFFPLIIGLKEVDSRLKPGMSVTAHVLSYFNSEAVLVPRTAVYWEGGKPFVKLALNPRQKIRQLTLGMADEVNYEVIEGLKPDDRVFVE